MTGEHLVMKGADWADPFGLTVMSSQISVLGEIRTGLVPESDALRPENA